jgi:hypothetical protein
MAYNLTRDREATIFGVREAVNVSGSTPYRYLGLGGAPRDRAASGKHMLGEASTNGRVRDRRPQIGKPAC